MRISDGWIEIHKNFLSKYASNRSITFVLNFKEERLFFHPLWIVVPSYIHCPDWNSSFDCRIDNTNLSENINSTYTFHIIHMWTHVKKEVWKIVWQIVGINCGTYKILSFSNNLFLGCLKCLYAFIHFLRSAFFSAVSRNKTTPRNL